MNGSTRRQILQLCGSGALACLSGAAARAADGVAPERQRRRTHRIFMVLGRGEGDNEVGFRDALERLGVRAEYIVRSTGGDSTRLPAIRDEIRAARPDLVYTWGTPQTLGVVGAWDAPDPSAFIRDIPVVFTFVAEPVDARIVRALTQPGGNITGTTHTAPVAAQINTIQAYRKVGKLGAVYNPAEQNSALAVRRLAAQWRERGWDFVEAPATLTDGQPDSRELPELIRRCKAQGAEMLYVGPDTFIASLHRRSFAEAARALNMPTFAVSEPIVRDSGGLFALSSSNYGIGRLTGGKAAQILLDGARPGDLPVERLNSLSVVVNMATARALSFYPSLKFLNFAEVVGA